MDPPALAEGLDLIAEAFVDGLLDAGGVEIVVAGDESARGDAWDPCFEIGFHRFVAVIGVDEDVANSAINHDHGFSALGSDKPH